MSKNSKLRLMIQVLSAAKALTGERNHWQFAVMAKSLFAINAKAQTGIWAKSLIINGGGGRDRTGVNGFAGRIRIQSTT